MDKYSTLNPPQLEAVKYTEGPLLLLAGAGSGKTRVLTHRIAYLIEEKKVYPWKIMSITFTNKAAKEMRERVDKLIGAGGEDVWVSTFHSSCVRILRRYIDKIGYSKSFSIYDTDDAKRLLREIMKKQNIDPKYYKDSFLLSQISSCKNKMISPKLFAKQAEGDMRQEVVARVYRIYQENLEANNALDFDDLLYKTVELFEKSPDVLEYYHNLFDYIMVDEYQDTNGVQFRLVELLAAKKRNLCVVGDDDQSIYRFRGADIKNILDFENVFHDAKVIRLEQNYRSTKNIIAAANQVIRNNTKRKVKKLWTDNVDGGKLEHLVHQNEKEEARFIAGTISEGIRSDQRDYKDYAILYRTNAQSRVLEESFFREGIPYRLVGGVSFYQRKEIKDVIAYLKMISNSTDSIACKRIINVPRRGIGATTVGRIDEFSELAGISFLEAVLRIKEIPNISRGRKNVEEFGYLVSYLKEKQHQTGLVDFIEEVLSKSEYISALKLENTDEANDRIDNIGELLSKAKDYEEMAIGAGEEATLNGFLEDVALVADIDSLDDDDNKVILMTLHSAKGLEFPIVFMAGMEDGLFPSYMSISTGNNEDIEEERRLCYVGITRAREKLYITSAKSRLMHGQTQYNMVSRFLAEIPTDLMESNQMSGGMTIDSIGIRKHTSSHDPLGMGGATTMPGNKPFGTMTKKANSYTMPKPKNVTLDYQENDFVKHPKYGIGQVKSIQAGGADYQVEVNFPSHGVKKLMASFAGLKKM